MNETMALAGGLAVQRNRPFYGTGDAIGISGSELQPMIPKIARCSPPNPCWLSNWFRGMNGSRVLANNHLRGTTHRRKGVRGRLRLQQRRGNSRSGSRQGPVALAWWRAESLDGSLGLGRRQKPTSSPASLPGLPTATGMTRSGALTSKSKSVPLRSDRRGLLGRRAEVGGVLAREYLLRGQHTRRLEPGWNGSGALRLSPLRELG